MKFKSTRLGDTSRGMNICSHIKIKFAWEQVLAHTPRSIKYLRPSSPLNCMRKRIEKLPIKYSPLNPCYPELTSPSSMEAWQGCKVRSSKCGSNKALFKIWICIPLWKQVIEFYNRIFKSVIDFSFLEFDHFLATVKVFPSIGIRARLEEF